MSSGGGGFVLPEPPAITDVICLSGCTQMRTSSPGGSVQVTGVNLNSAAKVSFAGNGKRIEVEPSLVSGNRVEAVVPDGARSGKVKVVSSDGTKSDFSPKKLNIGPAQTLSTGAALKVTDASTTPRVAYQYGQKKPKLSFVLAGGKTTNDLRIDIVSSSGEIVFSRFVKGVASGSTQTVRWNGKTSSGKLARNGSYQFAVRSGDGTAAKVSKNIAKVQRKAKRGKATDPFGFRFYGFVFPVSRGSHYYGDGLGAGRGHQGQDVMAKCGLPLIAARAGTVYYNDYQAGGAGNYVVINVKGSGQSHVYMHLSSRSPLKVGSSVKTGQRVGTLGTTGRSTACHLHFEIWSRPGWYQGGSPIDPTTPLKRWDRYS
ncbi:MAG: peptidoglycan DD-metalloendopeptidase family protein [Solirubrobacterales bacterium]